MLTQKHLKDYLIESQRVDEMVATMLAIGLICLAAAPMLKEFSAKAGAGVGSFFGGLANLFGFGKDKDKGSDRNKDKGSGSDNNKRESKKDYDPQEHGLFCNLLALAKKHTTDKANQKVIELLGGSSVDKDGNPLPFNKMGERMTELTGETPDDLLKAHNIKPLEGDELKKIQDAAKSELEKMSPEERKNVTDEQLEEARKASKAMQEYHDKEKKLEEELEEAKKGDDKDKVEAAQKALDDHKANASGPAKTLAEAIAKTNEYKAAAKKEDDNKSEQKGPDGEPEGTTAKEEEVVDKETGKKVKRKVYTGPLGGRYYYPDKSPHKPENKVYVESLNLSKYLIKNL